jgi:hypothetical protein
MGGKLGWRLASTASGRGHDEVIRVWESATGRPVGEVRRKSLDHYTDRYRTDRCS